MRLSSCKVVRASLIVIGFTVAGLVLAPSPNITADDGTDPNFFDDLGQVARVEEDWCLLIDQPDTAHSSPQVATQMIRMPTAPRFVNLTINSCDVPQFQQGGWQLQAWNGQTNLTVMASTSRQTLNTANELITWTQYLRRDGNGLHFGLSAASSQTWGDFSGQEIAISGAGKVLDGYDPNYSQQHSGVTYGANRVSSMVLLRARKIYKNGLITTDNTPRVIFSSALDPDLNPDGGGE